MITNAEITIFNAWADRQERKIIYLPHFIEEVWFYKDIKVSASEGGFVRGDLFKIRIPDSCLYGWLPPERYATLDDPETAEAWTVQDRDFFVIGRWTGGKVEDMKEVKKTYFGVMGIVNSHTENFYGANPHIRIGGGV